MSPPTSAMPSRPSAVLRGFAAALVAASAAVALHAPEKYEGRDSTTHLLEARRQAPGASEAAPASLAEGLGGKSSSRTGRDARPDASRKKKAKKERLDEEHRKKREAEEKAKKERLDEEHRKTREAEEKKPDCPVCFQSLSKGELTTTPCGHIFHAECLNRWLFQGRNSCPMCRATIASYTMIAQDEYPNILRKDLHPGVREYVGLRRVWSKVRRAAARALGAIGDGDAAAVDALTAAVENKDEGMWTDYRLEAVSSLAKIGGLQAATVLAEVMKGKFDCRIGFGISKHFEGLGRVFAVKALGRQGDVQAAREAAVPVLQRALAHDTNTDVRKASAEALGEVGGSAALPALKEALLRDHDYYCHVQGASARALAKAGGAVAMQTLTEALERNYTHRMRKCVKEVAARALAAIGGLATVPDSTVEAAATALKEAMLQTDYEDNREIVDDAAAALGAIGGAVPVQSWTVEVVVALTQVLQDRGPQDREPISINLLSRWETARQSAAKALGQIGGALSVEVGDALTTAMLAAMEALMKVFVDDQADRILEAKRTREYAALAVGLIGGASPTLASGTGAVEKLTKALQGKFVKEAALALGRIGGADALKALTEALRLDTLLEHKARGEADRWGPGDQDKWSMEHVARALGAIGGEDALQALQALIQAFQPDKHQLIRRAAAIGLHDFFRANKGRALAPGGADAIRSAGQALLKVFREVGVDAGVCELAADALGHIASAEAEFSDEALAALQKASQYQEMGVPEKRMAAIDALGRLGGADALAAVRRAAQNDTDVGVRAHAAQALWRIGGAGADGANATLSAEAVEALAKASRESGGEVLEWVIRALGEIGGVGALLALQQVLQGANGRVLKAAKTALQNIGIKDASLSVEVVRLLLPDEDYITGMFRGV